MLQRTRSKTPKANSCRLAIRQSAIVYMLPRWPYQKLLFSFPPEPDYNWNEATPAQATCKFRPYHGEERTCTLQAQHYFWFFFFQNTTDVSFPVDLTFIKNLCKPKTAFMEKNLHFVSYSFFFPLHKEEQFLCIRFIVQVGKRTLLSYFVVLVELCPNECIACASNARWADNGWRCKSFFCWFAVHTSLLPEFGFFF